jgi:hypothetical protein
MANGWRLIKILGAKSAGQVSMLDAKFHFIQALRQARAQAEIKNYLDLMLRTQPIELEESGVVRMTVEIR